MKNFDNSAKVWRLRRLDDYMIGCLLLLWSFSFKDNSCSSSAMKNLSCWVLLKSHIVLPAILKTMVAELPAADSAQQDRSNTQTQFLYVEQWSRIKFKYLQSLRSYHLIAVNWIFHNRIYCKQCCSICGSSNHCSQSLCKTLEVWGLHDIRVHLCTEYKRSFWGWAFLVAYRRAVVIILPLKV